jgi:hypothetical protein
MNRPTVAPVPLRAVWGGPEPSRDELRRDHALLDNANGVLVARVRALEAQLREHGIEPVPVPASARS